MDTFTSDERSEIAARLRDDDPGYKTEYDFLVQALGMSRESHGPCDWSKVHERLADLIEPTQDDDDICLTPTEAAEWLAIAPHTLANWRVQGRGPNFIRDGHYVAYPIEELRSYRDAHLVIPGKKDEDGRQLTETEAAKWLGIAPHTIADWRSLGRGPNFVRDGHYVVYPIEELRRYRDAHLVIIQKAVSDGSDRVRKQA